MKINRINHLAFITDDRVKTIRFYRDLLGMELTAGVGHDGYRHYFFTAGNAQLAFFEYEGANPMVRKFHGSKTSEPLGFDHVALNVETREQLFACKDRLEAAGVRVDGAVDHGTIWSIYFFDPNNIPLEVSWSYMEVTKPPAMSEDDPMEIVAEGAGPQPGHWPEVTEPTPPERMTAHPGNGYSMQAAFLAEGRGKLSDEYLAIPEETRTPTKRPDAA
jgi:catechol 2,3-dioxygenase-like lactoylglutathione lyase family enzyme